MSNLLATDLIEIAEDLKFSARALTGATTDNQLLLKNLIEAKISELLEISNQIDSIIESK